MIGIAKPTQREDCVPDSYLGNGVNITEFPLDERGIWREIRSDTPAGKPRPALFVDRDGTIIELVDYLRMPEGVQPISEAVELTARASDCKIPIIMVTNQSGVGRGYFGWSDFAAVQEVVLAEVIAGGGGIDAVYACPALPNSNDPFRKPNPGMLFTAEQDLGLDLARSWIVGDSASDLAAGARAGLSRGWLVATGHGTRERAAALALRGANFDVTVDRPLSELAELLSGL